MNAQEIIRSFSEAEKTTPVKVYYQAKEAIDFPNCHVFGPVVFGDWKEIAPVLEAHREVITDLVVENDPPQQRRSAAGYEKHQRPHRTGCDHPRSGGDRRSGGDHDGGDHQHSALSSKKER